MPRPRGAAGRPSGEQRQRVRDDIIWLCARGLPARQLLAGLAGRLRRAVPYDGAYLATLDPASLLFTGGIVDDLPAELCHRYYANELTEPDVLKFAELGGRARPAATLMTGTGGHLERSARFRSILAGLGAADEMRVVFRTGQASWGVADLMRTGRPFSPAETAFAASLSATVAQGLSTAARLYSQDLATTPGMLVIGADGLIESATSEATAQLPRLYAEGLPSGQLGDRQPPEPIHAVALRARTARGQASARSLVRCDAEGWLSLHASLLGGQGSGRVAVVMSTPPPSQLTPLLMRAYGLSAREREVTVLIAAGAATRQIAAALAVSEHTVRDHVKVIFAKVGASSRGELVATISADRYQRMAAGTDYISAG
jgi:DNA-binding CsgD family transcriptional regulator